MSGLEAYRQKPGAAAATAWWKTRRPLPGGITVVHAATDSGGAGAPRRFFKLVHDLSQVPDAALPSGLAERSVFDDAWTASITALIAACYQPPMAVTDATVRSWRTHPVCCPELWRGAVDGAGGLVGAVIAELDPEVPEMSLEWVQVLPGERGRGVARALVSSALRTARGRAKFAVVAGDLDNETGPERLYRACGFRGDDVWHIHRDDQPLAGRSMDPPGHLRRAVKVCSADGWRTPGHAVD